MSSSVTKAPYYFVPAPTRHPIVTSIGLLGFGSGASMWVNGSSGQWWRFRYITLTWSPLKPSFLHLSANLSIRNRD